MALAETVVILMRYAAIEEVNLNTEVQKPSLTKVLQFNATMECAIESTPHEDMHLHLCTRGRESNAEVQG